MSEQFTYYGESITIPLPEDTKYGSEIQFNAEIPNLGEKDVPTSTVVFLIACTVAGGKAKSKFCAFGLTDTFLIALTVAAKTLSVKAICV